MRAPLLLGLMLALAAPAAAQTDSAPRASRVGLTVFSGVRVPYNTGFVTLYDAGGEPLFSATEQRGGSALLGADAEVHLVGPLSLLVGGIFTQTGDSDFFLDRSPGFGDSIDFRVSFSDETLFARAGASLRLQEPRRPGETRANPATDLFAAAGLVRRLETNHPAVNFGFKGAFPLNRAGLEVVVGLEDFFVFWDNDALTPVMAELLRPSAEPVQLDFLYDTSNVLLLRAGLSLRF